MIRELETAANIIEGQEAKAALNRMEMAINLLINQGLINCTLLPKTPAHLKHIHEEIRTVELYFYEFIEMLESEFKQTT